MKITKIGLVALIVFLGVASCRSAQQGDVIVVKARTSSGIPCDFCNNDENGKYFMECSECENVDEATLSATAEQKPEPGTSQMIEFVKYGTQSTFWPPPQPTSAFVIQSKHLRDNKGNRLGTLGEVEDKIVSSLNSSGYYEYSFFGAPKGFSIITRLERFDSDGSPAKGNSRWEVEVGPLRSSSFMDVLSEIGFSNPGFFRMIAFVVSHKSYKGVDESIEIEDAIEILKDGDVRLSKEGRLVPFSGNHYCAVLIYEFKKEKDGTAMRVVTGGLSSQTHLVQSNLWRHFSK